MVKIKNIGSKKCKGCGKKATSFIRSLPVCDTCYKLLRRDNMKTYGSGEIKKTVKLIALELHHTEWKQYERYLKYSMPREYGKWKKDLISKREVSKWKEK